MSSPPKNCHFPSLFLAVERLLVSGVFFQFIGKKKFNCVVVITERRGGFKRRNILLVTLEVFRFLKEIHSVHLSITRRRSRFT